MCTILFSNVSMWNCNRQVKLQQETKLMVVAKFFAPYIFAYIGVLYGLIPHRISKTFPRFAVPPSSMPESIQTTIHMVSL